MGFRKFSARLWNIPLFQNWDATCRATSADILYGNQTHHFNSPTKCVEVSGAQYGEFYVPDNNCPRWGTFVRDECVAVGFRKYHAQLFDIPAGLSWQQTCLMTPADVAGTHFDRPTNCVDRGVQGQFGEFNVPANDCPHWGTFVRDECVAPGFRKYHAQLFDIAAGLDWQATCLMTPAVVAGTPFLNPTNCVNRGLQGQFGEFNVPDTECAATACGSGGQRACCDNDPEVRQPLWPSGGGFGPKRCAPGFVQVDPCRSGDSDDCKCPGGAVSPGRCAPITTCGVNGARACCDFEGHCQQDSYSPDNPARPCREDYDCEGLPHRKCVWQKCAQPGTIEVEVCGGDCTCGVQGASGDPAKSDKSCFIPEATYKASSASNPQAFPPLQEPTTGRLAAQTPQPGKRGFADLHIHILGNMGNGAGILAGAPYSWAPLSDGGWKGGIADALKQCHATTYDPSPFRQVRCCLPPDGNHGPPTCEDLTADACERAGGTNISELMGPQLDLTFKACDMQLQLCEGGSNAGASCFISADCPSGTCNAHPETTCTQAGVGCPSYLPNCGNVLLHGDHALDSSGTASEPVGIGTGDRDAYDWDITNPFSRPLSNLGWPLFNGWPTYSTSTHQQTYHTWLERAWQGGLRLIVLQAVTNEALCKASKRVRSVGLYSGCEDSMAAIDAQISAAYDLQAFIDTQAGGSGQGWFRIVTSPAQADTVIGQGKLAVVIGIEVDNLFNCKFGECDEAYVRQQVDRYYAMGVRHVFPVHNFENTFGAPATWQALLNTGNKVSEGMWWEVEDCSDEGYQKNMDRTVVEVLLGGFFGWIHLKELPGEPPIYRVSAACNQNSLSPLGEVLMQALIEKGMTIDIDHMSNHAIDRTIEIAEACTPVYPLVSGHSVLFDRHRTKRHERMRTSAQLAKLKALGGMIGLMTKDDNEKNEFSTSERALTDPYLQYTPARGPKVENTCYQSTKAWVQSVQYAIDQMGGPVALATDFNGIAGHMSPRFGDDACGKDKYGRTTELGLNTPLQYPFTLEGFGTFDKQKTGLKTFDFNVEGLAHVGMLPDMIADLQEIGLGQYYVDQLLGAADAYVQMWSRQTTACGNVVAPTATPTPTSGVTVPTPTPTPTSGVTVPTPTSTSGAPVPTPTAGGPGCAGEVCTGDCNGNCNVAVNELVTMVNIALGLLPVSACTAGDANLDQRVAVNEIVSAVGRALNGCPGALRH